MVSKMMSLQDNVLDFGAQVEHRKGFLLAGKANVVRVLRVDIIARDEIPRSSRSSLIGSRLARLLPDFSLHACLTMVVLWQVSHQVSKRVCFFT